MVIESEGGLRGRTLGFELPFTTVWDLNQLPNTGNPNPNLALSCSNALLFIMG